MRHAITALLSGCMLVAAPWASICWSQTAPQGATFIKPFPKDDIYRLQLIGDWFAEGLRGSIAEAMVDIGQVRTAASVLKMRSLRTSRWNRALTAIATASERRPIDIAVVMLGAMEYGSLRTRYGKRIRLGTEQWKIEYKSRVDRIMKTLKKNKMAVYWVGVPALRDNRYDGNAEIINEVVRERAYLNGVKYIDTYAKFSDEDGRYNAHGPDLTGKIKRLRARDGMYFTRAGYQKLAHFAKRVIASDVRDAIVEREIPLAGSELEQKRVNPDANKKDKAETRKRSNVKTARQRKTPQRLSSRTTSKPSRIRTRPGLKDQKADDGKVVLRIVQDGIVRTNKIKITRPAIPATVLTVLNSSRSADKKAQIGQTVQFELPSGIIMMNSIAFSQQSFATRGKDQFFTYQSPFFRVWAKGERLTPRPGRADDIAWPRQAPEPVTRTKVAQPEPVKSSKQPEIIRPLRKYTPKGFPPLPQKRPSYTQ